MAAAPASVSASHRRRQSAAPHRARPRRSPAVATLAMAADHRERSTAPGRRTAPAPAGISSWSPTTPQPRLPTALRQHRHPREFESLAEAAERTGLSTKTIRRRIASGVLAAYRSGPSRASSRPGRRRPDDGAPPDHVCRAGHPTGHRTLPAEPPAAKDPMGRKLRLPGRLSTGMMHPWTRTTTQVTRTKWERRTGTDLFGVIDEDADVSSCATSAAGAAHTWASTPSSLTG